MSDTGLLAPSGNLIFLAVVLLIAVGVGAASSARLSNGSGRNGSTRTLSILEHACGWAVGIGVAFALFIWKMTWGYDERPWLIVAGLALAAGGWILGGWSSRRGSTTGSRDLQS
jgi:protein-S-isoprenylcysteine O-methyltransferase Ste14